MAVTLTDSDATKAATVTPDGAMTFFSFPIDKMEEAADGTIEVVGKATDGTLDSDLQVVDPEWSRKALQEWFETGGNVRVQHNAQRDPAGKGIHVEGHTVRARVVEPVAVKLVKAGVLQDFSVGIMNPDIRRNSDPSVKHLDPHGKAVNGVITGRPDGMSKIGELSLVDRGSNFGTRFAMLKAAATGEPEWVGELTASDEVLAKVAKPAKTATVTVELPKNMSLSIKPSDLAKLTTFRQKLATEQVTKAKDGDAAPDAAMLAAEPDGDQAGDEGDDDGGVPKAVKTAEAAVYKRDVPTAERRELRGQGRALDNLSYPVKTHEDASNAVTLILSGHGDVSAARAMVKRIARKEGWTDILDRLKDGKKPAKAKKTPTPQATKKMKVMCGACGAKQNRKHAMCSECGKPLANAMAVQKNHEYTCLGCGKALDKGEKFCPSCGKENPGYLPEADRKIPANEDASKSAKSKGKKKARKGKTPFGDQKAPPFGKDKDGDDDDGVGKAGKGRVTKAKKGKKPTPGDGVAGENVAPAPRHREPDGAPMEALEADAGMSDGDNESPTHTEQLVGTGKAADPEMAAALTLKALGVPAGMGALHALTCPAYAPEDVAKAFPHDSFAGIDLGQWQMADLTKAASGPIEEALASLALGQHAAELKGADPYLLADLRAEAHKTFTDANPGPATFPTPGTISAARFNRPLITAGHEAASPGHEGPRHVTLPAVGGISAGQFTRSYLTEGHAADAPENTHSDGPTGTPGPTGVPSHSQARNYYTNTAKDSARHAMEAMHDHISRMFPDVCPLTGAEDIARHPVPTPQGVPAVAPAPGKKGKAAKAKARKAAARKAARVKARKAARRQRVREVRLGRQILKGALTTEQARARLGMEPLTAPEPEVTAEAAPALDAKTIAKAVKAAVKPLNQRLAAQDRALRKVRKETERIAAQPDTSQAPFRGAALTKHASAPPAGAPTATSLADQAQVTKVALLRQEWLNSSDPGAREAAYTELSRLLGISS